MVINRGLVKEMIVLYGRLVRGKSKVGIVIYIDGDRWLSRGFKSKF